MRREIQITGVKALWPRLDKPYRFDQQKMESVPCAPTADQAKYELSFEMNKEQAKTLWTEMAKAYKEEAAAKGEQWPEYKMPFKQNDDGNYVFKAGLKAAYNGEATRPPSQWDAKANRLPADFQLTTGSIVNLNVKMIPYNARIGNGVSLRLSAVQVIELSEMMEQSPFGQTDGSFSQHKPFAAPAATRPEADLSHVAHPFGEEFEAPKAKPSAAFTDLEDEIPF